jgi:peptide/nickel transport system permease protein
MIERPPSEEHPLGNDSSGRDNLSRLLYGGRISLIVGFSSMIFTLLIGVTLGSIAGYYGGKIDGLIMRAADMMLVLPFLVLVLTIVSDSGKSNNWDICGHYCLYHLAKLNKNYSRYILVPP